MALPKKTHERTDPGEQLRSSVEKVQRNTLWPDTLDNSREVTVFLWGGYKRPKLVQRIGALLFGLTYFTFGIAIFAQALNKRSVVAGVLSLLWFLLGIRVALNSRNRKRTRAQ